MESQLNGTARDDATTGSPPAAGYRGRFAPTPSGPLHAGSLLTALISYLDARAAGGRWLLRIDDLDAARCRPQHIDTIRHQLEAHGLHWDERVYRQSEQVDAYRDALRQLQAQGVVYRCGCSRALLAQQPRGPLGPIHPRRCLRPPTAGRTAALRLRVTAGTARLEDDWQPPLTLDWRDDIGDFVLQRADGLPGYALSAAVDEALLGISHVVRGADLLPSTLQHFEVLRRLDRTLPVSRHGPLLVDANGKLSKQHRAAAVNLQQPAANLWFCCRWLRLPLAAELADGPPAALLEAAVAAWRQRPRPPLAAIRLPPAAATPAA